jgi:hypothetical protein
LTIVAVALCSLIALFIAAPSTWGNGIVDHGGRVVQDTSHSLTAPSAVTPAKGHQLESAAHTLVVAVVSIVLGVLLLEAARRIRAASALHVVTPASVWAERRGPPSVG